MYYDASGALRENYYGEFRQMFGGTVPSGAIPQQSAGQDGGMGPPTRDARIIQVKDRQKARDWNVTGAPQMFMTEDEEYILIKQPSDNGFEMISYKREPPEPDVSDQFVKKEELAAAVAAALKQMEAEKREE